MTSCKHPHPYDVRQADTGEVAKCTCGARLERRNSNWPWYEVRT